MLLRGEEEPSTRSGAGNLGVSFRLAGCRGAQVPVSSFHNTGSSPDFVERLPVLSGVGLSGP